jgi:hypothetical protein
VIRDGGIDGYGNQSEKTDPVFEFGKVVFYGLAAGCTFLSGLPRRNVLGFALTCAGLICVFLATITFLHWKLHSDYVSAALGSTPQQRVIAAPKISAFSRLL